MKKMFFLVFLAVVFTAVYPHAVAAETYETYQIHTVEYCMFAGFDDEILLGATSKAAKWMNDAPENITIINHSAAIRGHNKDKSGLCAYITILYKLKLTTTEQRPQ